MTDVRRHAPARSLHAWKSAMRDTRVHEIGQLCVGGDWACAHGDLSTLGHVARRLAGYVRGPLHRELVELADVSETDAVRASELWSRLKGRIHGGS